MVVVITGGSNGLGYELGKLFAKKGKKVISLDLGLPSKRIKGVEYKKCDVTSSSDLSRCLKSLKKIDVLVCNAGVMRRGNLFEVSEDDFDLVMGVNLKGSWLTLKTAYIKFSDGAKVLFISSRHGAYLNPNPAIYSLSKRGVISLAKLLSKTDKRLLVKVATLGPFDSALSRHGVSKDELSKKLKGIRSSFETANVIFDFLEHKKNNLVFDQKKNKYFYK